jgi:hypothetical protein
MLPRQLVVTASTNTCNSRLVILVTVTVAHMRRGDTVKARTVQGGLLVARQGRFGTASGALQVIYSLGGGTYSVQEDSCLCEADRG